MSRRSSTASGDFTPDDLDLLDAMAGNIAVALENARLHEALRHNGTDPGEHLELRRAIRERFRGILGTPDAPAGIDQQLRERPGHSASRSWGRPARARSCLRVPYTRPVIARGAKYVVVNCARSPRPCWRRSCSASARRVHRSGHGASRALRGRTRRHTLSRRDRRSSSRRCRRTSSRAGVRRGRPSAASGRIEWTFASSRPRTATSRSSSPPGSARTSTGGSTSSRLSCPSSASGARTCRS